MNAKTESAVVLLIMLLKFPAFQANFYLWNNIPTSESEDMAIHAQGAECAALKNER